MLISRDPLDDDDDNDGDDDDDDDDDVDDDDAKIQFVILTFKTSVYDNFE